MQKKTSDVTALLTVLGITSGAVLTGSITECRAESETNAKDSKTKVTEKSTKSLKAHAKDKLDCYPCGCHYGGKSKKGRALEDKKNAARATENESTEKKAK
jgi:hypothetical protein